MNNLTISIRDISNTIRNPQIALSLGWQDIKQRYRRSKVGAFWLTLSMAIMIATLGFIFSSVFGANTKEFLPFLAVGLVFWGYMSASITDGCTAFIYSEGIIKQVNIPFFNYIVRVVYRNFIILLHNIIILPFLFLFYSIPLSSNFWLVIPGLFLMSANLLWISTLVAIICTRFRDVTQIINNIIQVIFYMTPIIWMPSIVPDRSALFFLDFNPMYHLLEIVRVPLLGGIVNQFSWCFSILMMISGWSLTLIVLAKFKRRIAYWL